MTLPGRKGKKQFFSSALKSLQNQKKILGMKPSNSGVLNRPPGVSDASESLVVVSHYPALGSSEEGRQQLNGLKYTNKIA